MNIERKSKLLNSKYFQTIKQVYHCFNKQCDYIDYKTGKILLTYKDAMDIYNLEYNSKDFKDCINIIHAQNKRYNNLLKRIKYYMNNTCLFITLTFNDNILNSTDETTRRKYVSRYLRSLCPCYIANIDFGDLKGREHYHGVIMLDDPNMIKSWPYGFANAQIISDNKEDKQRVTNYILKITNHFIKESASKNRAIYSRDFINWG